MASTIRQRLRRFNGTDYDTIHLESSASIIYKGSETVSDLLSALGELKIETAYDDHGTTAGAGILYKAAQRRVNDSVSASTSNLYLVLAYDMSGVDVDDMHISGVSKYMLFLCCYVHPRIAPSNGPGGIIMLAKSHDDINISATNPVGTISISGMPNLRFKVWMPIYS